MPLYAYVCDNCGHAFDKNVRISHRDDVTCPTCGSENVHRPLIAVAVKGGQSTGSATSAPVISTGST